MYDDPAPMTLLDKGLTRAKATDHVFMVAIAVVIGCAGGSAPSSSDC